MALITVGTPVSQIRGSVGGTSYSRNRAGAYARARPGAIAEQSGWALLCLEAMQAAASHFACAVKSR